MELKDGLTIKLGNTQVKLVEKLGDRAKFNSATNIEIRIAEIPAEETAQKEYLDKCVLWATAYYQGVDTAKKSGGKVNPRQIKKDAFTSIFGNSAPAAQRPVRPVTVVKAEPKQVSKPQPVTSVKLDPAELSKKFDTFKADDLPDSAEKGDELPPLLPEEDELLGVAHVASGEDVLKELGGTLPDISSLSDGSDIFG